MPDVAYTPRDSQRKKLNRKMRNEYLPHGFQLGWLIDPRPECRKMYEYFIDEHGRIRARTLEMALNQRAASSSEDEVDFICPEVGCGQRFRRRGAWTAHQEWHREEEAIARYEASLRNQ
ncbi:TPA: hypothetical protein N0F65_001714 [Lagenidium giganteum]|uniref:C2H2-type domain-containing protein n=1 Tax=Lagenidium giganteum TaxID=4803 RepID=A0AAV2Z3Y0_9STRA|nr:TPA: hypothetical protein N0F65_001714 [Lagenidium giganteum]